VRDNLEGKGIVVGEGEGRTRFVLGTLSPGRV